LLRGDILLDQILTDLVSSVKGARAVIFLDGEGESIALYGEAGVDMKFLGAWKEIHLDRIREITGRLKLGEVHAVLFSLEEGNELLVPVAGEYCLLLLLSSFADLKEAMAGTTKAVELLKKEVE